MTLQGNFTPTRSSRTFPGRRVHNLVNPVPRTPYVEQYSGPFHARLNGQDKIKINAGIMYVGINSEYEWPQAGDTDEITISGTNTAYIYFSVSVNVTTGATDAGSYDLSGSTTLPGQEAAIANVLLATVTYTSGVIEYYKQNHYGDIYVPVNFFHEDSGLGNFDGDEVYYASWQIGAARGIPYAQKLDLGGGSHVWGPVP